MIFNPEFIYPIPIHETWDIQDATKIKCFMECPRKYFFEYTLGWRPSGTNIHLIFGSAWHEALAYLYTNSFSFEHIKIAFHEHFLPYYRKSIFEVDDDIYTPKTPKRAYLALAYYAQMRELFIKDFRVIYHEGTPMVEIGGTIDLSDNHKMSFKMDTIGTYNGGIVSLEHKTGSSTWNWNLQWYLNMQMGIYTHVLNCLYDPAEVRGIIVDGTFFKKTKDNPKTNAKDPYRHFDFLDVPVYMGKPAMNQWLNNTIDWINSICNEFNNLALCHDSEPVMKAFPMNTTGCTNWFGCQYHDYCRAWANPLQHCEKPPIGYDIDFWNPLEEEIKIKLEV